MANLEESDQVFHQKSAKANKSLALGSYNIGASSGLTLGLGIGGEVYSVLAENLLAGIPSTLAIAIGAVGLLHSRQDIKREINWALEDQAKSVLMPDNLPQATE